MQSAILAGKAWDVAQKITLLEQLKALGEVDDVSELAKKEARLVPKPPQTIDIIATEVLQGWKKHSYQAKKIARFILLPFLHLPDPRSLKFYIITAFSPQGFKRLLAEIWSMYVGFITTYYLTSWALYQMIVTLNQLIRDNISVEEAFSKLKAIFDPNYVHGVYSPPPSLGPLPLNAQPPVLPLHPLLHSQPASKRASLS